MKVRSACLTSLLLLVIPAASLLAAAADDIWIYTNVARSGFSPPIPVAVSGFNGEVDGVFRFDMTFNGFTVVSEDKARYVIQGANSAGRVEARVLDPYARKQVYGKAFTGSSARAQTHALADDICQALANRPGIAQTKIAFRNQPTGSGAGEIYVADYDGFNPQAVTRDGVIVAAPSWGGRSTLFYTSYKPGKPDIFSHNLSSGERHPVARYPGSNISPAVSPDGRRVAMVLSKDGYPNLYVSDAGGGNLRRLTTGRDDAACPCWSPDNQTICFASARSGRAALYTVSASGGAATRLPTIGVSNPSEPDWSPDGKFIIFTANMGSFQVCYVPADGPNRGHATVLTAGEDPVWAPNSRAVIFTRRVANRRVLSLLDVPTKQVKDAARISGHASQPSWAR